VNNIAKNITFLKKKNAVTQFDIGLRVNKSSNTISGWENEISEPGIKELKLLSEFFGISIDDLVNIDLANVNLNNNDEEQGKQENVNLNVNQHVNLNTKKVTKKDKHNQPISTSNEDICTCKSSKKIEEAQQKTIETLEALNSMLQKHTATLEEEIKRLKREIPIIGNSMDDKQTKSA